MIDFCVLPKDGALVSGLLNPLNGAVAGTGNGAGIGARTRPGGNQYWIVSTPGRMNRAAIIQCANVDVNSGRRGLVSDHRAAERGVERHALMRHGNKFGSRPTFFLSFGDALLPERDFRSGNEEQMIHTAELHRGHESIGPILTWILVPTRVMGNCLRHRALL